MIFSRAGREIFLPGHSGFFQEKRIAVSGWAPYFFLYDIAIFPVPGYYITLIIFYYHTNARAEQLFLREHIEAIIYIKSKKFSLRSFTSITLFFSFFGLALSGLAMFLRPEGSVARWIDWSLLGLSKNEWEGVHTFFSITIVIFSVIHLFLNGKMLLSYVSGKWKVGLNHKMELFAAVGLMLAVLILPVFQISPAREFMDLRNNIKHGDYSVSTVPPEPDFEKKPFSYVVRSVNMPVDLVLARLRSLGLTISDDQESLQDIARKNNSTPQAVYLQIIHLSVE